MKKNHSPGELENSKQVVTEKRSLTKLKKKKNKNNDRFKKKETAF